MGTCLWHCTFLYSSSLLPIIWWWLTRRVSPRSTAEPPRTGRNSHTLLQPSSLRSIFCSCKYFVICDTNKWFLTQRTFQSTFLLCSTNFRSIFVVQKWNTVSFQFRRRDKHCKKNHDEFHLSCKEKKLVYLSNTYRRPATSRLCAFQGPNSSLHSIPI